MKRKELYKYIREEIISELNVNETILNAVIDYKDKSTPDKVIRVDDSDVATVNALKTDPTIANLTIGKKIVKKGATNESDLEEASKSNKKIQN